MDDRAATHLTAETNATRGAAPDPVEAFAGRTFDAVLFDLDGTLVDSTASVERAWLRWAREEHVEIARMQGSHGMPAAEIVIRLLPEERHASAIARIMDYEVNDVEGTLPRPGSVEALASLPPERLAIVTSCTGPLLAARAGAAGLTLPATTVTADDVSRGKPDPEPFRLGAQRLGFAPARCLAVEDAPAGLTAARAAGCATLAVDGTHALDQLDADASIANLSLLRFAVDGDGIRVTRG